jgi:hypothetical protein
LFMPAVVIVIQDRPVRLLCQHVFAVARWSTDVAPSPLDALAIAYNAEADLIITTNDDEGAELIHQLSHDEVLRNTRCVMLLPPGTDDPSPDILSFEAVTFPCDPYWIVAAEDIRLGRETPRGLGRRAASNDDLDTTLHRWWWALATTDLVQHAALSAAEAGSVELFTTEMAHRLGCRVGAEIASAKTEDAWQVQLAEDLTWSIRLDDDEPLSPETKACIGSVVSAVRSLMPLIR